jgi:hypothetical protein
MSFHYCNCFWVDSVPLIVYPKMSLPWLLMYFVGMVPVWIVPLVFDLMAVTNELCGIWYEDRSCYTCIHNMWNVNSTITKCMCAWYKVMWHTQTSHLSCLEDWSRWRSKSQTSKDVPCPGVTSFIENCSINNC